MLEAVRCTEELCGPLWRQFFTKIMMKRKEELLRGNIDLFLLTLFILTKILRLIFLGVK